MPRQQHAIPPWLRWMLLLAACFYLYWLLWVKKPVMRNDFPFFRKSQVGVLPPSGYSHAC